VSGLDAFLALSVCKIISRLADDDNDEDDDNYDAAAADDDNDDVDTAGDVCPGLDAFMALSVCKILSRLADQGKLVICVIHQPSSETFELFSHLLLLAQGTSLIIIVVVVVVIIIIMTNHQHQSLCCVTSVCTHRRIPYRCCAHVFRILISRRPRPSELFSHLLLLAQGTSLIIIVVVIIIIIIIIIIFVIIHHAVSHIAVPTPEYSIPVSRTGIARQCPSPLLMPSVCTRHPVTLCSSPHHSPLATLTGRTAFLGRRDRAVEYFSELGYECPRFYNPADYLIEELAVNQQ
jgi:hypothetical protein